MRDGYTEVVCDLTLSNGTVKKKKFRLYKEDNVWKTLIGFSDIRDAVDQACLDMVFSHQGKPGDDNKPLIERINRQHGTYITDYAEQIGLGSKTYTLVNLDK